MALIGWMFCFLMLGVVTLGWFLSAAFGLSKHTIGGAKNTLTTKVTIIIVGFVIIVCWSGLLSNAPFEVILK